MHRYNIYYFLVHLILYSKCNFLFQKFLLRFFGSRFLLYFSRGRKILEGRTDRQHLRITTRWSFEDWGLRSERSNHERFHSCHPRWRTSGVPFRRFPSREDPWNDGAHSRSSPSKRKLSLSKKFGIPNVKTTCISRELIDRPPDISIFNRSHCLAIRNKRERERESESKIKYFIRELSLAFLIVSMFPDRWKAIIFLT